MPIRATLTLAAIVLAWAAQAAAQGARTVTAANDFGRVENDIAPRPFTPFAETL